MPLKLLYMSGAQSALPVNPWAGEPAEFSDDRPGVRHRIYVLELVGFDHRSDRLDLPAEHFYRQRADAFVVPIAEDRPLAVQLV